MGRFSLVLLGVAIGVALSSSVAFAGNMDWWRFDDTTKTGTIESNFLFPSSTCRDEKGNFEGLSMVTVDFTTRRITLESQCSEVVPVPAFMADKVRIRVHPRIVLK